MPRIVDYPQVYATLTAQGLICRYHNSGAFGLPGSPAIRGWIGLPDPTIRPELQPSTRQFAPPSEHNLAASLRSTWEAHLQPHAWAMPMSHWGYELEYGSKFWMPDLLQSLGIDPKPLRGLNNAAAVEFAAGEGDGLQQFVLTALQNLGGSDFMLAFPPYQALCMIHHHKQLWWTLGPALNIALD